VKPAGKTIVRNVSHSFRAVFAPTNFTANVKPRAGKRRHNWSGRRRLDRHARVGRHGGCGDQDSYHDKAEHRFLYGFPLEKFQF
jgi:hypothetical protein